MSPSLHGLPSVHLEPFCPQLRHHSWVGAIVGDANVDHACESEKRRVEGLAVQILGAAFSREMVLEALQTVSVTRRISIVNYTIGTFQMLARIAIVVYVIHDMWDNNKFLEAILPACSVRGWAEEGTLFTGAGQTYNEHYTGERLSLNVSQPHYCYPPYANDYVRIGKHLGPQYKAPLS
jgi:hypothetical protein